MSFDVLDLTNLSSALGSQVNGSRLAPHITTVGNDIRMYSDDDVVSRLTSNGILVGQTTTFEFDLTPVVLPANLADPTALLFYFALHDVQDNIAALQVSQAGIAFVAAENEAGLLVPNSAGLFAVSTRYTVRIVLDGLTNIIDLYVTPTADVATLGHQLVFTSGARDTPATLTDGFTLAVIGSAVDSTELLLHTLRVSSSLLIPNRRPVAVAEDVAGVTNQAIQVDGSESYDPEGASLTYAWTFTDKPTGSTITDADLFPTKLLLQPGAVDPAPGFVPDKEGEYKLQLTVNDGSLDSVALEVIITATASYVARGYTPSADPIFAIMNSDWSGVEDRDVILTFWSALMQIAAADMTTVWQNDRNKSVDTIGRRSQRRWLDYDASVDLSEETFTNSETVGVTGGNGATPYQTGSDMVANGSAILTAASAEFQTRQVTPGTAVRLSVAPYTTRVVSVTNNTEIVVEDTVPPATGIEYTIGSLDILADNTVGFAGIAPGQTIQVAYSTTVHQRKIAEVFTNSLTVTEPFPEVFTGASWKTSAANAKLGFDLPSEFRIQANDLAVWRIQNNSDLTVTEEILAVIAAAVDTIGTETNATLSSRLGDTDYTVTLDRFLRTSQIPVHEYTESIPFLQSIIKDPDDTDLLQFSKHYTIEEEGDLKWIQFNTPYDASNLPPDTFWAEYTYLSNNSAIEANFGHGVGLQTDHPVVSSLDFDYLSAVKGLMYCYLFGPSVENMRRGIQIFCGLPFAAEDGTITRIDDDYTTTRGRIIVQGKGQDGLLRTYFYKRALGIATNPTTGVDYTENDAVEAYAPLSKGVEVVDWLIDALWWKKVGVEEVEKYFLFQVGLDINILEDPTKLVDLVSSVVDFVRKVKPVYTDIIAVLQAKFTDTISITDSFGMELTVEFAERVCADSRLGEYGEVKSDGTAAWEYGGGLQWGHAAEICPKDALTLVGCTTGPVPVQWGNIFRYGDPIQYGGTSPSGEICTVLFSSDPALPGSGPTGEK